MLHYCIGTFDLNSKIVNKNRATYFYYFSKSSPSGKNIVIGNIYPTIIRKNSEKLWSLSDTLFLEIFAKIFCSVYP